MVKRLALLLCLLMWGCSTPSAPTMIGQQLHLYTFSEYLPAALIDETTLASGNFIVTSFKILSTADTTGAAGFAAAGLAGAGAGFGAWPSNSEPETITAKEMRKVGFISGKLLK